MIWGHEEEMEMGPHQDVSKYCLYVRQRGMERDSGRAGHVDTHI